MPKEVRSVLALLLRLGSNAIVRIWKEKNKQTEKSVKLEDEEEDKGMDVAQMGVAFQRLRRGRW